VCLGHQGLELAQRGGILALAVDFAGPPAVLAACVVIAGVEDGDRLAAASAAARRRSSMPAPPYCTFAGVNAQEALSLRPAECTMEGKFNL
jgi:hypothetical protein